MLNSIHKTSINAAIAADHYLQQNSCIATDLKKAQKSEVDILTYMHSREKISTSPIYSFFVNIGSFILGRNLHAYLTSHNANLHKLLGGITSTNHLPVSPILKNEYRRLEHINHLFAKKAPYQTILPLSEEEQIAKISTFQNDCEVVEADFNCPSTQVARLAQNRVPIFLHQNFTAGVATTTLSVVAIAFIANKYFNR